MMSKRLVLIAVAALGVMCSEIADARVCWLGDTSEECSSQNYGPGTGDCSSDYKACVNPRAGATYCVQEGVALYKEEDCCTTLKDEKGYQNCNEEGSEKPSGYGESCLGAKDNIRYYEFCGCPYGFIEADEDGNLSSTVTVTGELEYDNIEIPFEERCGLDSRYGTRLCKFATCNADRRWFYQNAGDHCEYRLDTRCGGLGCKQLYNCNNLTEDGREYYRNEDVYLEGNKENFISFDYNDPLSNEKRPGDGISQEGPLGATVPYNSLITGYNAETGEYSTAYYELTNKIVCAYEGNNGLLNDTIKEGFDCNGVNNYCYLFNKEILCNNSRGWFRTSLNNGKIYYGPEAYENWMKNVENNADYSTSYASLYKSGVIKAINETFEYYNYGTAGANLHNAARQSFFANEANYTVTSNTTGGCVYISHECHPNGNDDRHCYKRIACDEENGFFHSFINAANYKELYYASFSGLSNASLVNPYAGVDNVQHLENINTYKNLIYKAEYEKLNKKTDANGLYLVNLDDDQIDRYIYPACVYNINACNDTQNEGLEGGGCYGNAVCADGFDTTETIPNIAEAWEPWFRDVRPVCNNMLRCYKATSCNLDVGAYSSEPNTSFFITGSSTGSGTVTCYRGMDCREEAGAYSSTPNTSFFFVIDSHASGSICYRGESCHIAAGAYSSTPNTSFFLTVHSVASGSIAYRAYSVNEEAGAYSSIPNTSFFFVAESMASGSTAYRAERAHEEVGAYTSTPNTSFFTVISSEASGSIAYRAEKEHTAAGAYSSEPNTSFFITISSEASGSTAYRAERSHEEAGAYTSEPNTSFFTVISSEASGSIAYRAEKEHADAGAYNSEPNTSFFITISSEASGSTAYRAERSHEEAGAYTSEPNTSFFITISSEASGSIAYRAESAHIKAGAYSSTPNTSFFITVSSEASGSTCYRGIQCRDGDGGVYTSSPNTDFFDVISSKASGSECYRGQGCGESRGSYSSSPNTSFFVVINSGASGSTCYRSTGCAIDAGAYNDAPNTSFFNNISSHATGEICYRSENCNEKTGAYSSAPNTVFFNSIESLASGSSCYRGESCAPTANKDENTSFFILDNSKASGSTCYRSNACNTEAGAYSSTPNTSFFVVNASQNAEQDSTCYRGTECHLEAGAYTSEPNTSFFLTIKSLASGSTSYRAYKVNEEAGAYTSTPNTSFFFVEESLASGSASYRAVREHKEAGAYTSEPNTSFFKYITSEASGSTAYRVNTVNIEAGAYSSTPNTLYFHVITSEASGSISYRAESANFGVGAYTSAPNTSFFNMGASLASGSMSYRGGAANVPAGAYSSSPNTSFFFVISSQASGSTAYRAESAHIKAGAYTSEPNTSFFLTISSKASGSTAYRAYEVNAEAGAYTSEPNTSFFVTISSSASGSVCYRGTECNTAVGSYTSSPNTVFFKVDISNASGSTCYRSNGCAATANADPDDTYFVFDSSDASGAPCYRSKGCNTAVGAYSSKPNTSFFVVDASQNAEQDSTCYRGKGCHIAGGAYNVSPNTKFFDTISSLSTGKECFRAEDCSDKAAPANRAAVLLNTSFFVQTVSQASGSTCYRGDGCNFAAGAYASEPNTSYFHTISSNSPTTACYRADMCHIAAGAYSAMPNTSFFITNALKASDSTCFRGTECRIASGAYTSEPNTSFFITISSKASGSICFRGEECRTAAGSYSSKPNTDFFIVTESKSSGSTCYRADIGCGPNAKTTETEINTSFFNMTNSSASGIDCYRGDTCNTSQGAYSVTPNTNYFHTISSNSPTNNTRCFRADLCDEGKGAYTSEPNTSFFMVSDSHASGSICFRGTECRLATGAYSSSPNTSFFMTISSEASGSTCFRGTECRLAAGAYTSTPNTLFFNVTISSASGLTCYRGDACRTKAGAYSSEPNTSFFVTITSLSSKESKYCYRGTECYLATGAYTSTPNTDFFEVISSKASGSTCFRGEGCHIAGGAYTSEPNTSFFVTIESSASGSTCYRGTKCRLAAGAYNSEPNETFFLTISSKASGTTCFRGEGCYIAGGAYTSEPNTSFFATIESSASGSTCYRGTECHMEVGAYSSKPNALFFLTISSKASGTTCFRGTGCNEAGGAYTSAPNNTFFVVTTSLGSGLTCYRGDKCAEKKGSYSSEPSALYFNTISSVASNSTTCYRATGCNLAAGAYSSSPNTLFFIVDKQNRTGQQCYRATDCRREYSDNPLNVDTSYFALTKSVATGVTCYRADSCNKANEAYSSAPNACIFNYTSRQRTIENNESFTCYIADSCATDSDPIDSCFFATSSMTYGSKTCTYATGVNSGYTSAPNVNVFTSTVIKTEITAELENNTCKEYTAYYATGCNNTKYWYNSEANAKPATGGCYFTTTSETSSRCSHNQTCYTVKGVNTDLINDTGGFKYADHYTTPNITPKVTDANGINVYATTTVTRIGGDTSGGSTTYTVKYPTGCNDNYYWYNSRENTEYFKYMEKTITHAGNNCTEEIHCYKASSGKCTLSTPQQQAFNFQPHTTKGGTGIATKSTITHREITGCKNENGYYETASITNTSYFAVDTSTTTASPTGCNGFNCSKAKCDNTKYSYSSLPDASIFEETGNATAYGITCKKCKCRYEEGEACSNTGYFVVDDDNRTDNLCGTNPTKCLNEETVARSDECHLMYAERCNNDPENKEVIIKDNGEEQEEVADTYVDSLGNEYSDVIGRRCRDVNYYSTANNYAKYYLWGAPKQCATTIRRKPTGCNEQMLSYRDQSTSGYTGDVSALPADERPTQYSDVFVEHSNQDSGFVISCNEVKCYIACSCNQTNGWFASPAAARSHAGADDDDEVVEVTSNRRYAKYTNSSGSLADADASSTSSGRQTCYKAPRPNTCPDGYFYSATRPTVPTGIKLIQHAFQENCYDVKCDSNYESVGLYYNTPCPVAIYTDHHKNLGCKLKSTEYPVELAVQGLGSSLQGSCPKGRVIHGPTSLNVTHLQYAHGGSEPYNYNNTSGNTNLECIGQLDTITTLSVPSMTYEVNPATVRIKIPNQITDDEIINGGEFAYVYVDALDPTQNEAKCFRLVVNNRTQSEYYVDVEIMTRKDESQNIQAHGIDRVTTQEINSMTSGYTLNFNGSSECGVINYPVSVTSNDSGETFYYYKEFEPDDQSCDTNDCIDELSSWSLYKGSTLILDNRQKNEFRTGVIQETSTNSLVHLTVTRVTPTPSGSGSTPQNQCFQCLSECDAANLWRCEGGNLTDCKSLFDCYISCGADIITGERYNSCCTGESWQIDVDNCRATGACRENDIATCVVKTYSPQCD